MFGDPTVTFFGALLVVVKYVAFFSAVLGVFAGAFVLWVFVFWLLDLGDKWLQGIGERAGERVRRAARE